MKALYLTGTLLVFLSFLPDAYAQRFFSVVFDKLPKDNQLFARDDNNEAAIPISGFIEVQGFTHMSAAIYRDGKRVGYAKSVLQYDASGKAAFSLSPKITAELSEYSIEVYASKTSDSIMMVKRDKIIAGDFYVINGQSNAAAITSYRVEAADYVNKFSRTLGRVPDENPGFTTADTIWKTPDWVTPVEGYWGRDLQRQIIETYKIPVCILNGAVPGTKISQHLDRVAANPAYPGSIYGHLLYRVNKSQATRIRAFFWYQGEEDAWLDPGSYPGRFDQLMKFWQTDYPVVDKFVIIQINIMDRPHYAAGALRDLQRMAKYNYPKTDHFTVIGLGPLQDNVHYTEEGYGKLARQLRDYLGPKVYRSGNTKNVDAPDVQKVFYSKNKDAVTMVFDENQAMKWQADTISNGTKIELKNQFFLDGDESKPAPVSKWEVSNNRVTIFFQQPATATKLNYLPAFKYGYYQGPFLQNIAGVGAFSFHEVPIYPALGDNTLIAKVSETNTIQLDWQKSGEALSYVLEKKTEGQPAFTPLKTFDKTIGTFEDPDVALSTTYVYRLKAIGTLSESSFSETTVKTMTILATEPASDFEWKVYPNPTQDFVEVEFKNSSSGSLEIVSAGDQKITSLQLKATLNARIDLTAKPAGLYLVTFRKINGDIITRKIVKF